MPKVGFVSIIGLPNAGKSTLLNKILNKELSIVTYKPQTTRDLILGVKTGDDYQMIFQDTPGILVPHNNMQDKMLLDIKESIKMADVILWLIDISKEYSKNKIQNIILDYFFDKTILVLNKVDKIKEKKIFQEKLSFFKNIAEKIGNRCFISAKNNIGIENLENIIINKLPMQNFYFPKETITDKTEEFIAAEKIREQIFLYFSEEIPYSIVVEIERFKHTKKTLYIDAVISVKKRGQKSILIGKNGNALKKVGIKARKTLESFFKKHVFLKQYVKIN